MLCLAVNSTEARFQPIDADLDGRAAMARAIDMRPELVCIVSLSPTRGSEVRGYCRQLRAENPDAKLLVLRPNVAASDISRSAARMKEAGADCVATNITEALAGIECLCSQGPAMEGAEPAIPGGAVKSDSDDESALADPTFATARR
jgi:hypothetical protein